MAEVKKETLEFDAEIGKVLDLMINSLYTNKEIFLRELLSNASDACDKLRYQLNVDSVLAEKIENDEIKISIALNEKEKTITISDNGIGMSKDELIKNLGTIARSGTQRFMKELSQDEKKGNELIGQFGVGFYSSFMIAEKVTVTSSKAGTKVVNVWESTGAGKFSIGASNEKVRGTKIVLHLKEDSVKFLDSFTVKGLVKTYSDHVPFPIELEGEKEGDATEIINSSQAIWARSKSTIKADDYNTFYKTLSHDLEDPWMVLHNSVEGILTYTNLLFIPKKKPFDLFHPDRKSHIKLYVKKVFITEDNIELIPPYLRFMKGVIDSQDIALNISRETLQNNALISKIRSGLVKKVLGELSKKFKKDKESYLEFWNNFGPVLKEGLCEHTSDKEKIFDISLFKSLNSPDKYISLSEYAENMKEEQKEIYYLIGSDVAMMQNSPQIEYFKEKNIDVLFFVDGVDDFWVTTGAKYQDKEFKSATRADRGDSNISEEDKEKQETADKSLEALLNYLKEELKDLVSDVKTSTKLTSSPVCLVASDSGMDIRIERMLIEQGQLKEASKKILEINPNHKIINKLNDNLGKDNNLVKNIALTLYDQACILEGETIKDPVSLAKRITDLLEKNVA